MMKRLLLPLLLFICFSLSLGPLFNTLPAAQATATHRPGQQTKPGEEKNLLVYPNPSTGIVHLTISGLEGRKVEVSIINVIGTVMYHETLAELNERYTKTLDLTRFANGLYYVKLEADNASQLCKLVIR